METASLQMDQLEAYRAAQRAKFEQEIAKLDYLKHMLNTVDHVENVDHLYNLLTDIKTYLQDSDIRGLNTLMGYQLIDNINRNPMIKLNVIDNNDIERCAKVTDLVKDLLTKFGVDGSDMQIQYHMDTSRERSQPNLRRAICHMRIDRTSHLCWSNT